MYFARIHLCSLLVLFALGNEHIVSADGFRLSNVVGFSQSGGLILCFSMVSDDVSRSRMTVKTERIALRISQNGEQEKPRIERVFSVTENAAVSFPGASAWPARSGFLVCDDRSISLLDETGQHRLLYQSEHEILPVHLVGSSDASFFAWANRSPFEEGGVSIRVMLSESETLLTKNPRFMSTALTGESAFFKERDGTLSIGFIDDDWTIRAYNTTRRSDYRLGKLSLSTSLPRIFSNGPSVGVGCGLAKLVFRDGGRELVFGDTPPGEPVILGAGSEWLCTLDEKDSDKTILMRQRVRETPAIKSFELPIRATRVSACGEDALLAWNSNDACLVTRKGRLIVMLTLEYLRRSLKE